MESADVGGTQPAFALHMHIAPIRQTYRELLRVHAPGESPCTQVDAGYCSPVQSIVELV